MADVIDVIFAKICLQKPFLWIQKLHGCLHKFYDERIKLQKLEFWIVWLLIISTLIAGYFGTCEKLAFIPTFYYMKLSLFTRLISYAIDIDKAKEKFGIVPSWIVIHHFGVIVAHVATVLIHLKDYHFYFAVFGLLGFQTTQNTWIQKYSLFLYIIDQWIGIVFYSSFAVVTMNNSEISLLIRLAFFVGQFFMFLGIYLKVK